MSTADGLQNQHDDIYSTIIVGSVGFTILVVDHVATFPDEFRYIWRKPKQFFVYLFLLNRYLTPFGFIVNLWAYTWSGWATYPNMCQHFVRYEGAMDVIGINVAGLMMLLRTHTLYKDRLYVVAFAALILLVELVVNCWLVQSAIPALPTTIVLGNVTVSSCTMNFSNKLHKHVAPASAWLPLLYETVIFALTMYRVSNFRKSAATRRSSGGLLLNAFRQEGLAYYSVIFTVNLVLTIMIGVAPPHLQNIAAQFALLLTVAMMSRITIHLKKETYKILVTSPVTAHFYEATTSSSGSSNLKTPLARSESKVRSPWKQEPVNTEKSLEGNNILTVETTQLQSEPQPNQKLLEWNKSHYRAGWPEYIFSVGGAQGSGPTEKPLAEQKGSPRWNHSNAHIIDSPQAQPEPGVRSPQGPRPIEKPAQERHKSHHRTGWAEWLLSTSRDREDSAPALNMYAQGDDMHDWVELGLASRSRK